MKVRHFLLPCAAMTALLAAGCVAELGDEPMTEETGLSIRINGSVEHVATKVNAAGFEDEDALGLYAVNYEDANQTPGTLQVEGNQADHVKYIFDNDNGTWNPVKAVYYKDVNTNVDLYAFYPFAEPSSVSEYNFEVKKDQSTAETEGRLSGYEASDFLWAKVENVAPTDSKVSVKLKHRMAGVQVILAEGSNFEEGEFESLDKKVLVTGTTRKAEINMSTGIVTPVGAAQSTGIVMAPQTDGSFRAVVVPQTVAAGTVLFRMTVDGINYGFVKDTDFEYVSGKLSKFTITVNKKTLTGEYEFFLSDTQILDWTEDLNTHEGEARQYYCVNVTEPGTLGSLIEADGKDPDKIRNLKVSGTISDEDFYFMRDCMAILEAVNLKESKVVEVGTGEEIWGDLGNGEWGVIGYTEVVDDVIPSSAFNNKKTLYYFEFPEVVTEIKEYAFANSSVSGTLVIPDDVKEIKVGAFEGTNITSLVLPSKLEIIGYRAFSNCSSLSGTLTFPMSLKDIGEGAFEFCSLSGNLILPDELEYIGGSAFDFAGKFTGDLKIPDKIRGIYYNTFSGCGFTGKLDLNNVVALEACAFDQCEFTGEVIIPQGVNEIGEFSFRWTNCSNLVFPESLRTIGREAFWGADIESLVLPDGFVSIGECAFGEGRSLKEVRFPATLQSIQSNAFGCPNLSYIICEATEVPNIMSDTFFAVNKETCILEVPATAVKKYQADPYWGEFKNIRAHYEFTVSSDCAKALNATESKTYTLEAPANLSWSVAEKPDWITVSPDSGTGAAEITVTFSEMTSSDVGTFEYEMTDEWGNIYTGSTAGRAGEVIFLLNDKDYTATLKVEQHDCKYKDGDVETLQQAGTGNGVNVVIIGDGYDAKDIAFGDYLADMKEAMGHFFGVEPYLAYQDYFNVYVVFGMSNDSGLGTENNPRDGKFGSLHTKDKGVVIDEKKCFEYACKAPINGNLAQTLIILVQNSGDYGSVSYMYGDGSVISCCPKSDKEYPYDFRGVVQHEAGGHGFGKLGDEAVYYRANICSCSCSGCAHVDEFNEFKSHGWYRNLELTGDPNQVGWSHLIFNPEYSDYVDVCEGGYYHSEGVYRSEATSCMYNNIPYFSTISRQAIVERIMEYAGEEFTMDGFYEKDSDAFGAVVKSAPTPQVTDVCDRSRQYAPIYKGYSPELGK